VTLNELTIFNNLILGWFVLAAITFISLFFFTAPYGRYIRSNWGPTIDNKKGWILMEAMAPLIFAICFLLGNNPVTVSTLFLLVLWEAHYIHRTFIYPFSLRGQAKQMPIVIMISALIFNTMNGYLNGRYIFTLSEGYTNEWLTDVRFITGLLLFVTGFIINRRADLTLRNLRQPGESDYKIPYGALYTWISCPNYFGEIIIWFGWALATWSPAGLAFAVWTIANLVPRAQAHHKWYHEHFTNYPQGRKTLVPRLW
jgi:protein-S-isoprenylcysteine O-methyltransferase Ste14